MSSSSFLIRKINGVCICFRQADYKPTQSKPLERRSSDPAISSVQPGNSGEDRLRSNTLVPEQLNRKVQGLRVSQRNDPPSSSPSLSATSPPPTDVHVEGTVMVKTSTDLSSAPPPLPTDIHDEGPVIVKTSTDLASAPPPLPTDIHDGGTDLASAPPLLPPSHSNSEFTQSSYPTPPATDTTSYPPQSTPPPPTPSPYQQQPSASFYPPPRAADTTSYPPQSTTPPPTTSPYQQQPPASFYPPPPPQTTAPYTQPTPPQFAAYGQPYNPPYGVPTPQTSGIGSIVHMDRQSRLIRSIVL